MRKSNLVPKERSDILSLRQLKEYRLYFQNLIKVGIRPGILFQEMHKPVTGVFHNSCQVVLVVNID